MGIDISKFSNNNDTAATNNNNQEVDVPEVQQDNFDIVQSILTVKKMSLDNQKR